ncbi:MAG: alpha/beta fold hydrolase [Cyanobacteria bacterium P01_A01_bin.83]
MKVKSSNQSMWHQLGLVGLGIVATLYITLGLLLRYQQNRLIFIPSSEIKSTPQKYGLNYQEVWIDIEQDQIHGWWIPSSQPNSPALLYFHGNGSNNGDLTQIAAIFHQLEVSVLMIDYRGYGKSSPIFPNEARVYEDAEAAWQYLTTDLEIKPQQVFVYGHSLGGAIAIELATRHPEMAGLITEGTFTSMKDMASLMSWVKIFPLDWLITQEFDSLSKIQSLQVPWLIFHGTADETIPLEMAKQLAHAGSQPKQIEIIAQANHNNLPEFGGEKYLQTIKQFMRSAISNQ